MICPKCGSENTLVYACQPKYEHMYKLKKDGTIYKIYSLNRIGDSDYDCVYCKNCLKELEFDVVDGKIQLVKEKP